MGVVTRPLFGYPFWTLLQVLFVLPLCVVLYLVPNDYLVVLYSITLMFGCFLLSIMTIFYTDKKLIQLIYRRSFCGWAYNLDLWALSLFILMLALFIGVIAKSTAQEEPSLGVVYSDVSEVRGVVIEDSVQNSYGSVTVLLEVQESFSHQGGQFSAQGVVFVRMGSKNTYLPYWGELVSITGSFHEDGTLFYGTGMTPLGWRYSIFHLRSRIMRYVESRVLAIPSQGSELLLALLLGRKIDPQSWVYTLFRQAGSSHILALSGMHLAIMATLITKLLGHLVGSRGALKLSIPAIGMYLFIAGFTPSLVRGALLYTLVALHKMRQVRPYMFHLLVCTFGLQVTLFPYAPMEIGFQLSYLALGGILLLTPSITPHLRFLPSRIRPGVAGGISAQIATLPFVLTTFGSWYPVGIVSGVILLPLITLFIWIGLVVICIPSGVGLQISSLLMDYLFRAVVTIAQWSTLVPSVHL